MTWKPYLAVLILVAGVLSGLYLRGLYEEAGQADILRQQIKAAAERQDEQNAIAQAAEDRLRADRENLATLNRKWNAIRANKDRAPCQLDADALRMLRDADAPNNSAR